MHTQDDREKERALKDLTWYNDQLRGDQCLCERWKKPRHSFCRRCFSELPDDLKRRLYFRLGGGYEEAFEEAHKFLEVNVW